MQHSFGQFVDDQSKIEEGQRAMNYNYLELLGWSQWAGVGDGWHSE